MWLTESLSFNFVFNYKEKVIKIHRKEVRGVREAGVRERENIHLSTSDRSSSDACHSVSTSASPGRAPSKPHMNFLQPCHQRVAVW